MPRAKHQLRIPGQGSLPWGPEPWRAPQSREVIRTATLGEIREFDGVWTNEQVVRLQRLGFSPRLVGLAREVAFAHFQGHERVRDGRWTFDLRGSAWPVKGGRR